MVIRSGKIRKELYFKGQSGKIRKRSVFLRTVRKGQEKSYSLRTVRKDQESQEMLFKLEESLEKSGNFCYPCTEFVLLLKLLKNSLDLSYVFKGA